MGRATQRCELVYCEIQVVVAGDEVLVAELAVDDQCCEQRHPQADGEPEYADACVQAVAREVAYRGSQEALEHMSVSSVSLAAGRKKRLRNSELIVHGDALASVTVRKRTLWPRSGRVLAAAI